MQKLIKIHPADNVMIVTASICAGEVVSFNGEEIFFSQHIAIGHKIAARAIAAMEKIIKYGVPIGTATAAIAKGEHVHLHNLKSDYLPTYTL